MINEKINNKKEKQKNVKIVLTKSIYDRLALPKYVERRRSD